MAVSKQVIKLNENIHSATRNVSASLDATANFVDFSIDVIVNSEEEKASYPDQEKLTKRAIDADDDLNSQAVSIYNSDIRVISKKIDATHTLLKISFVAPGKVPATPGG